MTAISIAEEKLAVMEAEESEIQLKETTVPEIEEMPGQITIWDILQTRLDLLAQHELEMNKAA